jgi:hypothetical protein
MSDEYPLTLRQADQARADFAAIADDLEFIKAQLARIPTRKEAGAPRIACDGSRRGAGPDPCSALPPRTSLSLTRC